MNRSVFVLAAGGAGVILGTFLLISFAQSRPVYSEIILQSEKDKRNFLENCGVSLKNEPPDIAYITLPMSSDTKVFGEYCILQSEQNLPLSEHFGEKAEVWTFAAESSACGMVQLICTENGLLVGAMHYDSTSFDRMYSVITS